MRTRLHSLLTQHETACWLSVSTQSTPDLGQESALVSGSQVVDVVEPAKEFHLAQGQGVLEHFQEGLVGSQSQKVEVLILRGGVERVRHFNPFI